MHNLEEIMIDAVHFTEIHMKKLVKDNQHVGTLLFLHGTGKPHLDLLTYTNTFCEGILYSNFYKKYNRFPTREELRTVDQIRKNMLKGLGSLIVSYEIKGNINIISR